MNPDPKISSKKKMKKALVSRTDRIVGQLLDCLSGSDNGEIQKK